jgi:hypothetical protein
MRNFVWIHGHVRAECTLCPVASAQYLCKFADEHRTPVKFRKRLAWCRDATSRSADALMYKYIFIDVLIAALTAYGAHRAELASLTMPVGRGVPDRALPFRGPTEACVAGGRPGVYCAATPSHTSEPTKTSL